MTALAAIREIPGLVAYLDDLEERLEATVRAIPVRWRRSARTRSPPAASGCGRCSSISRRTRGPPPLAAGVAVELIHMATLVHDDLIDGAEYRRGREAAWAAYGPDGAQRRGRLPVCAGVRRAHGHGRRSQLSSGSPTPRSASPAARPCSGGRRTIRRRRVESYLERCALKTGKLFEAACMLGCGGRDLSLGEFGVALGIAFQITDDILDCTGEAMETGKIAGVDLREGTPTLPLLLAAREDSVVYDALAGGPLDGALARVASHRRARALAGVRARVRRARARLSRRAAAPRGARGAHVASSSTGRARRGMATIERISTLGHDPREGRGGRAARRLPTD